MELTTELVGVIVALVGSVTALVKSRIDINQIQIDRETTAHQRDTDSQELHDKVLRLEFQCNANKDSIADFNRKFEDTANQINALNRQLAEVLVRIDNIADLLTDIRDSGKKRKARSSRG